MSGMPSTCLLTRNEIEVGGLLGRLDDAACGGQVIFVGRVRSHHRGKSVLRLEYEAHEKLALKALTALAQEAQERFALGSVVLAHRLGSIDLGGAAVLVAAAAAHRDAAFDACRHLIDAVKATVPIWKHEFYADGSDAWVGSPGWDGAKDLV